jgi:hypothetical protein
MFKPIPRKARTTRKKENVVNSYLEIGNRNYNLEDITMIEIITQKYAWGSGGEHTHLRNHHADEPYILRVFFKSAIVLQIGVKQPEAQIIHNWVTGK